MREEPPKPTIEFRNDRYLCIAVVRRLGFELRNPYEAVIGVFDRTSGSEEPATSLNGDHGRSAVLEQDTHDLHGQERKMRSGGPRIAVGRTGAVIAKKEAALRRP